MSLNPIIALDHVIEEYRDYLRSEFRAKDSQLLEALDAELEREGFLAQEPFYQAHRPFKSGARWRELPVDPKLATALQERSRNERAYLHQSDSISNLLGASASPLVVTTGTGSGKTECFLVPVIQNALEDAARYKKSGLTAILIYPMNALANDQLLRIEEYLGASGFSGSVSVRKYDRGTPQSEREELRRNPPHILLTNYMMLEYLLIRPADRDDIFANHRCRFLVLDEVHTYRGVLGSNIALLIRRLKAHLKRARQDWKSEVGVDEQRFRYPTLLPIGTSATIKNVVEEGLSREEVLRRRDASVQEFFGRLTGSEPGSIKVCGEELEEIVIPPGATIAPSPMTDAQPVAWSADAVRNTLCRLAGIPDSVSLSEAAQKAKLLWLLNQWLVGAPMSLSQIVERLRREVPERGGFDEQVVQKEVEMALVAGAALPDMTPGALRLRAHRFIRGGWKFYRCVNPTCGKIYPMGEERCECGHFTAPLYLCRSCGADYLRFSGDPDGGPLQPGSAFSEGQEWMLYDHGRLETNAADEEDENEEGEQTTKPNRRAPRQPTQVRGRQIRRGSFDVSTLNFSTNESDYALKVTLVPGRTRCLCCGGTAGSRNVITPVALGTSAAIKVLSEGLVEALVDANADKPDHDGKERLLVFSDSRQDAAHQARFIIFASRYDRMRRRLIKLLSDNGPLSIQRVVELLGELAVRERDNPNVVSENWTPDEELERIRSWEEAPLLDEISVNASFRATVINLGLVNVGYNRLEEYVRQRGAALYQELGITEDQLLHVCRCVLDELRVRGCFSREMLRYHPKHPAFPKYIVSADWERKVKQPKGVPVAADETPIAFVDAAAVPLGVTPVNVWRRPGVGGRGPSLEKIFKHLLEHFGAHEPHVETMVKLLTFLKEGRFLVAAELFGARDRIKLLQVNAEAVRLELTPSAVRLHCDVCSAPMSGAKRRAPCPRCHGMAITWTDAEVEENRTVRRLRAENFVPLYAAEHTAQVPNDMRVDIEENFKAGPQLSKLNLLACSPTLELGIDVGGLDAVVLRNVPPRPDNYAQRGGRAGRRSRVGLVLGYARSTPHDQYFFDKPAEMISGEIPAPALSLANRDVILRHLSAIAFGAATPGLAGRMVEYVSPTGEIKQEQVTALCDAVRAQVTHSLEMAQLAWGAALLEACGLDESVLRAHLEALPVKILDVFERTARQVQELRTALDTYSVLLTGQQSGTRSANLVARLLGIQTEQRRTRLEADDSSAGYPPRRFAEFGILPGYEFPSEPASLRLLGDPNEENAITVARRFGISEFMPDANVFARTKRWKVIGLDNASPWNPRTDAPWGYRVCRKCELRFATDHPRCPRCSGDEPGPVLPGFEFGGFLAQRNEAPVFDEEERYAGRNLVQSYPQWDGEVFERWSIGAGWAIRLSRGEEVRWLNEGVPPTPRELQAGVPILNQFGKGFNLCAACGRRLSNPTDGANDAGGRRRPRAGANAQDPFGHAPGCPRAGSPPIQCAIVTAVKAQVLRMVAALPESLAERDVEVWGYPLGAALRIGMRHLYLLDGPEIELALEGPWRIAGAEGSFQRVALAFIDPSVGGSGYLPRIAREFNLVANRALDHLDHPNCETACYRCLKSYQNQRHHDLLEWPRIVGDLEQIAAQAPESQPLEVGDIDNPKPWLEAYAAGVGSPLELKFLRLFEKHGFHPQKQVPVSPLDGQPAISVADFAVPERRLAVYVDGACFHTGVNLRRDRFIRQKLRQGNPPWKVVELRARDLAEGAALVARLRSPV